MKNTTVPTGQTSEQCVSVDELTRLAFIHGEQDLRGLAEAHGGTPTAAEFDALADQMHRYRVKRWGRTGIEAKIANATLVEVKHPRFQR